MTWYVLSVWRSDYGEISAIGEKYFYVLVFWIQNMIWAVFGIEFNVMTFKWKSENWEYEFKGISETSNSMHLIWTT